MITILLKASYKKSDSGDCKRCVSIYEKHDNVLQYKESKCMMDHMRNYNELCRSISVDEPLKTLFRVNGESTWQWFHCHSLVLCQDLE